MATMITFSCRSCTNQLSIPAEQLPIDGRCPECGTVNHVANPASEPVVRESSAANTILGASKKPLEIGIGVAALLTLITAFLWNPSRGHDSNPAAAESNTPESRTMPTTRKDGVIMVPMSE